MLTSAQPGLRSTTMASRNAFYSGRFLLSIACCVRAASDVVNNIEGAIQPYNPSGGFLEVF